MHFYNQTSWKGQMLDWLHVFMTAKAVSGNGTNERKHAVWNYAPVKLPKTWFYKQIMYYLADFPPAWAFFVWNLENSREPPGHNSSHSITEVSTKWTVLSSPSRCTGTPGSCTAAAPGSLQWICPTFLRSWASFTIHFTHLFEPSNNHST